jgi:dihydrofolate reductase
MSTVLWHTQVSLDGYVAGPNDDMRWAFEFDEGPDPTIDEVLRTTGALLVGRRTQDVEDREQPGFYGGAYRGPFFVLRHDPPRDPPVVKGVTGRFLDVPIEEAVAIAKDAANGGTVVVLGPNVAKQCLMSGLLDEILLHVTPVLLGEGIRLFEHSGGPRIALEKISVHEGRQLTAMRYAVARPSSRPDQ